jgi:mandelamide amidase
LTELDATAAVAAMRRGDLRAEDYARSLLDRARSLQSLNAFRALDRERVLEAARAADLQRDAGVPLGLLHGLPVPVKDSVDSADMPTSNGTHALRDFVPERDAAVLASLRAHGAILMGKTNLHELSRGWTCNNRTFGAVLNPYDPRRIPGGSSGGSAVAVAARMAPLAVAEDTLGSIRVPAALCGVAGLRPTHGRYPGDGIMSLTLDKFDQVGPLARSVSDLILFDMAVTGDLRLHATRTLHGLRLGVSPAHFLRDLDPEVERVVSAALERLEAAGVELVYANVPEIVTRALPIATAIIAHENVASISGYLDRNFTRVSFEQLIAQAGPNIQALYRAGEIPGVPGGGVSREAYEVALRERADLKSALRSHFREHAIEALVHPPVLAPAPPLGDNLHVDIAGGQVPLRTVMGRNTAPGSVAGLCSLVLPAGLTAGGLPVGLEFAGLPRTDRDLLALGCSLEEALGPIARPAS